MIKQEQIDAYKYQQTEQGKALITMADYMRRRYIKQGIPPGKIKTGKLTPVKNLKSGKIECFIEE